MIDRQNLQNDKQNDQQIKRHKQQSIDRTIDVNRNGGNDRTTYRSVDRQKDRQIIQIHTHELKVSQFLNSHSAWKLSFSIWTIYGLDKL